MSDGFVIIANPQGRRVHLFQDALQRLGRPPAVLLSWIDLLKGKADIRNILTRGRILRIDSPGQDFEVERAILARGAREAKQHPEYDRLPVGKVARLQFDKGRILPSPQWYVGFSNILRDIDRDCKQSAPHKVMQAPEDIRLMFCKPDCHALLESNQVCVPKALSGIRSFHDLSDRMRSSGLRRVFVKLACGSSASGVVAYQTDGRRHLATTTVEMETRHGQLRLYNSRRILEYDRAEEVEALINALCEHCVHVEQWIPKAGINNKTFDLRVVTIAGRARHVVVRLSRGPMTNLHLLNERDNTDAVRLRMGEGGMAGRDDNL